MPHPLIPVEQVSLAYNLCTHHCIWNRHSVQFCVSAPKHLWLSPQHSGFKRSSYHSFTSLCSGSPPLQLRFGCQRVAFPERIIRFLLHRPPPRLREFVGQGGDHQDQESDEEGQHNWQRSEGTRGFDQCGGTFRRGWGRKHYKHYINLGSCRVAWFLFSPQTQQPI